jgi:SAM-dependent methyltransferase
MTQEDINNNQFLPSSSEEHYNELGKKDCMSIIEGYKRKTNNKLPSVVVDLGCGNLRIGRFLSKYCKKYVGVDISQAVLDSAKSKVEEYNLNNVELVLSDNFKKKNFCDFLICMQVIQHNTAEGQLKIVQQIKDILKPNGWGLIHLPKLEIRPNYKNCDTCMCFTLDQVAYLFEDFPYFEMDNENQYLINNDDYYLWVKK